MMRLDWGWNCKRCTCMIGVGRKDEYHDYPVNLIDEDNY